MRIPTLNEAIDDANFYHYSKPMSVFNINTVQIPYPVSLEELNHNGNQFLIRISHGLPHVIPAMELVDDIYGVYGDAVPGFNEAFQTNAQHFEIEAENLLQLIRIAVIFHDTGRKGNGMDLWDEESADICKDYLSNQCQLDHELASFIADTIRYKDNEEEFKRKYSSIQNADYIRQLVNMADALEVIRTRDIFKPEFLPIAKHVNAETMVGTVIPGLVVPHRAKVHAQGRLSKEGRIEYKKGDQIYEDNYDLTPGKNYASIAQVYNGYCETYNLAILDINERNLEQVFARATRGIDMYLSEYRGASGIQWTHNGFFSPRYHGSLGITRAERYRDLLNSEKATDGVKIKVLYALFASHDGKTLQETVLRSFGHANKKGVFSQLNGMVQQLNPDQDLKQINEDVQNYVFHVEGIIPPKNN